MAALIEWGVDDCATFMFGPKGHEIDWLKGSHDETAQYLMDMDSKERLKTLLEAFNQMDCYLPNDVQPGDLGIGSFSFALGGPELPDPWFAKMEHDCHWYVRTPRGAKPVSAENLTVFRCRPL